jgi:hypothetical protein
MPLPPSGNIEDVSLPALLQELHSRKATATLTIVSDTAEKRVVIKDGLIIFATSTDNHDRLGEMLVKAGKLTRENLATALDLVRRSGGLKKLGALLVERGFVSPKDLFTGLKMQVKEIIYSLFLLDAGSYRVEDRIPPDTIHLQIDIEELVAEIIQRMKQEA